MTKHWYKCRECQKEFWSYKRPSSAPKLCTECLPIVRRRNIMKLQESNLQRPKPVGAPCEVCGRPARIRGTIPYKTCGGPECRLEVRRRRGKEYAGRRKAGTTISRECLRCSRSFMAPHRFLRICPTCKDTQKNGQTEKYAEDVWGSKTI